MATGRTFQQHPLYDAERKIVDRLLQVESPSRQDVTECARLFIRYDSFPGAIDLHLHQLFKPKRVSLRSLVAIMAML